MTRKLLTDEKLRAIEERVVAATPGPWRSEGGMVLLDTWQRVADCTWEDSGCDSEADSAFIAGARSDVPRFLADLHRYRAWCKRLVVACEETSLGELIDVAQEVRAAMEGDGER